MVYLQNELRMLSTALGESKHQLLQKMAGTVDRPACKQLEVCFMRKNLLLRVEAGISVLLILNVIQSTAIVTKAKFLQDMIRKMWIFL